MYRRLEEEQDPDDPDPQMRTFYTDKFPIERLEKIVKDSLARGGMTVATDNARQRFLQALGTLRRKTSENVRYNLNPDCFKGLSTRQRQSDSVSAADLRRDKRYYFTELTRETLKEEQVEFFDELAELGSDYNPAQVSSSIFKSPLNAAIADHDPERRFINQLLEPKNLPYYDAWIKSTTTRFYEIDYAWKKGEHPKRGKFSPDFFIKARDLILVVEIKDNEELRELSEENKKKNEYAVEHFKRVNEHLKRGGSSISYKFNFLTPSNLGAYFQYLRNGNITDYKSELDVALLKT